MTKVSIIIPSFNTPKKWLLKCLSSVMAQTLKEIEIIIINDGSTNGNEKILDSFAEKDKRIRVIHQENKGVSAARNAGLPVAAGKYVTFVDSDDRLAPDAIETAYRLAEENNCQAAGFVMRTLNGIKKYTCPLLLPPEKKLDKNYLETKALKRIISYPKNGNLIPGGTKIIRKDFLERTGLKFNERLKIGEDTVYCFELLCLLDSLIYTDRIGYFYNKNQTSATANFRRDAYLMERSARAEYNKILERTGVKFDLTAEEILADYIYTQLTYLHLAMIYDKKYSAYMAKDIFSDGEFIRCLTLLRNPEEKIIRLKALLDDKNYDGAYLHLYKSSKKFRFKLAFKNRIKRILAFFGI